jgi:hypothetical protein
MPFRDVTDIILNEEAKELEEMLKDPQVKKAHEQFKLECRLRRELYELKKKSVQIKLKLREMRRENSLTQTTH